MRPSTYKLAWAVIIVCAVPVALFFVSFARDLLLSEPGPKDLPAVERQAQFVYDELLAFRRKHGRYPKTLAEIGVDADSMHWGGWDYDRYWFSDGFKLSLGNYERYSFVLWRDHDDPKWSWDR